MQRRDFIIVCAAMLAWPRDVVAQYSNRKEPPAIGFLYLGTERSLGPPGPGTNSIEAFRSGFPPLGYTEGENIQIYYRYADGSVERFSELARELVALGVKVIVTAGTTSVRAAHATAPSIPIVAWASGDPIAMGWAKSLARPGGMITGTSILGQETWAKTLEVLRLVRPEASTFAALLQADNPANPIFRRQLDDAASQLGIKLHVLELKEASGLPGAFRQMISLGAQGVYIVPDPVLGSHRAEIIELARQHKLPTVSDGPFANEGGLVALVLNYPALAKRSAWYVDQILKGAAPGDLPIEQARDFWLVINLKTAKALGLTIPPTLLARADEVIE